MKRLIVSGVSGTVTDLEEGATEFNSRFISALTRVIQMSAEDVALDIESAMEFMDRAPSHNGWFVNGEIVAPATADPFVRMRTAAGLVLDLHNLMLNPARREAWLDRIFTEACTGLPAVFKEDALQYLAHMDQHGGRFIGNGDAGIVQGWFDQLAGVVASEQGGALLHRSFKVDDEETRRDVLAMLARCKERVHGDARRHVVEPMLQVCVPELRIPGLDERPVLLHRGSYFRLLKGLVEEARIHWDQLWVVDDIFELGLALPWALGATVVVVDNGVMPDYERRWLATQDRVHITETLKGACEILFG